MRTNPDRRRLPAGEAPVIERGWMAGRMVDGCEVAVDGRRPAWHPPNWIRLLVDAGYDATAEGQPFFVVTHITEGELGRFATVREAFRFALEAIEAGRHPESLAIDCRTPSGRVAPVVWGRPLVGMAHGALEAQPIRRLEAPGP